MDLLSNLAIGFDAALSLQNLAICLIGCLLGTAIGVLPGLGPAPTIAMLLPITYAMEPISALIMLSGIYYGSQYGGSTTSILINLPGEASSVVTCIDGYKLAQKGRAGPALAIAAIGSFAAGCIATVFIAAFAPTLTRAALLIGPPEYFTMVLLGLVGVVVFARGSVTMALATALVGVLLGLVGNDKISGTPRFTFGVTELADGIDFSALAMGFYAFAEIIRNLAVSPDCDQEPLPVGSLMPTKQDMIEAAPAVVRSTLVGSLIGLLPGGGAIMATWVAYVLEKSLSKHPETFGEGAIAGVAAPESANNASVQTSFIPMLTLGVPTNGSMAMMAGAMLMHNVVPGPRIIETNPVLFWGLIASMWIGNAMLLVLNLPLVGIWVRLLRVPYAIMFPAIIIICCIGIYGISGEVSSIYVAAGMTILAYAMTKVGCDSLPLILGFIIGPMLEDHFRRAMLLSRGDLSTFVSSWISIALLLATLALLATAIFGKFDRLKE